MGKGILSVYSSEREHEFISEKKGGIWSLKMRVEHGRGGKGKLRPPGCSQQEVGSRCMRAGPVWWAVGSVGSELILVVFLVAPGAHLLLEGRGAGPLEVQCYLRSGPVVHG